MDQRQSKRQKLGAESDPFAYHLARTLQRVCRAVKRAKAFELQHCVRKIKLLRDGPTNGKPLKLDLNQLPTLEAEFKEWKAIEPLSFSRQILSLRFAKISQITPSLQRLLPVADPLLGHAANKLSSNKQLAHVMTTEVVNLRKLLSEPSDPPPHSSSTTNKSSLHFNSDDDAKTLQSHLASGEHKLTQHITDTKRRSLSTPQNGNSPRPSLIDPHSDDESFRDENEDDNCSSASRMSWDEHSQVRPTASTFLPALNVGYTRGDSDASSVDDSTCDRVDREMGRKNRRGQRARRAIWEKKFGKGAKHLQKVASKRVPVPPPPPSPGVTGSKVTNNANLVPMGERKAVHPSWEAKVKQQEALAKAVPMGKKIVFD